MEFNNKNTILVGKITIQKLTASAENEWKRNRKDIASTSGAHRATIISKKKRINQNVMRA